VGQAVSDNPYAPSLVDPIGDAPPSRGWDLVNGRLLVEPDAVLPMIDPYSGETADRMTLMRTVLRPRVLWPRYLFVGSLSLSILFAFSGFPKVSQFFSVAILVALFGGSWTSIVGRSVMIHVFLTRRTRRRQALTYWWLLGTVLLLLLITFFGPSIGGDGDWIYDAVGVLAFVGLVTASAIRWLQRRLYWSTGPDHRKELRGLHPRAIELLAKAAAARRP
jgi:MFS family permease